MRQWNIKSQFEGLSRPKTMLNECSQITCGKTSPENDFPTNLHALWEQYCIRKEMATDPPTKVYRINRMICKNCAFTSKKGERSRNGNSLISCIAGSHVSIGEITDMFQLQGASDQTFAVVDLFEDLSPNDKRKDPFHHYQDE